MVSIFNLGARRVESVLLRARSALCDNNTIEFGWIFAVVNVNDFNGNVYSTKAHDTSDHVRVPLNGSNLQYF